MTTEPTITDAWEEVSGQEFMYVNYVNVALGWSVRQYTWSASWWAHSEREYGGDGQSFPFSDAQTAMRFARLAAEPLRDLQEQRAAVIERCKRAVEAVST